MADPRPVNPIKHKRIIWFAFVASETEHKRIIQPYQLRDILAFTEVLTALDSHRYERGWEVVVNAPGGDADLDPPLDSDDLVVVTTRFPMHDESENTRKAIPRTGTALESSIFEALTPFYRYNSRTHVCLSDRAAGHVVAGKAGREDVYFPDIREAAYHDIVSDGGCSLTPGYLSFTPAVMGLDEHPCFSLLCLFGMSGHETLAWARYLARRYARGLRRVVDGGHNCFMMAEWPVMTYPRTPDGVFQPRFSVPSAVEFVVEPFAWD